MRAALDHWAGVYGVDPSLVRALAWMESGYQHDVVLSVGARWASCSSYPSRGISWTPVLLGVRTPRINRAFLRWQLDQVGGRVRWGGGGGGAGDVRLPGLYGETKVFVRIVLALYGTV